MDKLHSILLQTYKLRETRTSKLYSNTNKVVKKKLSVLGLDGATLKSKVHLVPKKQ